MKNNPQSNSSNAEIPRACPGCGNIHRQPVWHKGNLHVKRCLQCDLYYASPVAADLASGKFYNQLAVLFYLSPDKLESDYAPVRFEREMQYFRKWCPAGQVLDVGCSTGAFLYRLQKQGNYQGVGVDIAGPALDYAESKGLKVVRKPFLSHDFGNQQFHAVTFWAVLEHLIDPLPFLQKAADLLKPNGLCFILVPNRKSLAVRLLGSKYRYIMPEHLNYFSQQTLLQFIQRTPHLKIVDHSTIKFNPLVIVQDLYHQRKNRVPDAERAKLLKKTIAWKQSPRLAPLRWAYNKAEALLGRLELADNLIAIARKSA